jgi:hypothetical protein
MLIEQCECGGAICSHGTCTRCQYCPHCGPGGREHYEDMLADAIELNANREIGDEREMGDERDPGED